MYRRIATGALPLLLLALFSIAFAPTWKPAVVVTATLVVTALTVAAIREPLAPSRAWRTAAYVAFPILVYCFSYASSAHIEEAFDLFHRGESIGPASDYLRGKVPYRDVFPIHGMLEDGLLDAWLMQIFGRSVDVALARTAVLGSLLGVALWYLGIAFFRSIPLALLVVAMGSWTTAENNRTFFQVAAVALFWIGCRPRSTEDRGAKSENLSLILSGVFAGIALFFSLDIGLYTIAGGFAAALLLAFVQRRGEWSGASPLRIAILHAIGIAIGVAPFLLYLGMHGAADDFVVISFSTIPQIIDAVWSLPFPDLTTPFRRDLSLRTLADFVVAEKFHLVLSPLVIAIALVYYLERLLRRHTDEFDHALLVLTIFAAVAQRTAFGRAEFRHQYFAAFLIGPILALLAILLARRLRSLWREGRGEGTRPFLSLVVAVLVVIVAALFWIPDLINHRLDDLLRYQARVTKSVRSGAAEEVGYRITEVAGEIRRLTRPDEPIFDFSNQPAFYFFADRPNPTRFYQVPILSPTRFQAETIRQLERTKPNVVLRTSPQGFHAFDGVPNVMRAQAVAAYLDDCYRFHRSVRGVEVWTRNPAARPAALESYLRRIRLPTKKELAAAGASRLVFPIVGSAWGLAGAHWVSDVTLHNPFRDPIEVKLRYVSGTVRADRRLTMAPRQTVRWPDVVKSLFNAPETIGTLWLEHSAGRAPVAVVKTWDEMHRSRATVETPLSYGDAATAGSDSAEMTIVGIPPSSPERQRRVNVGVVNLGVIPATFRITARDRRGAQIGGSVESGVAENELWLVTGIEDELGVALDETTTLRITVIAGIGAGFATVVDPDGSSEYIAAVPSQQP